MSTCALGCVGQHSCQNKRVIHWIPRHQLDLQNVKASKGRDVTTGLAWSMGIQQLSVERQGIG